MAAYFLPLLFPSWRLAVVGLGVQGALLGILLASHPAWSWSAPFELLSLLAIRAVFVPWYLFRSSEAFDARGDFALIAKSLVQWTIALALLGTAFAFGRGMSPDDPGQALHVGTAAGSVLIALLILANHRHPLGQIIALLTFEGGVTLVELLSPHAVPAVVRVGFSLAFVLLVLTCGTYVRQHERRVAPAVDLPDEAIL